METPVEQSSVVPLLGYCISMFAGAFFFGNLPFFFSCSAARMRIVSICSAGLLTGTALLVIIPEGVFMWMKTVQDRHESGAHDAHEGHAGHDHDHEHEHEHGHAGHEHNEHDWRLGAALAFGFALMIIVDQLSQGHGHSHDSLLPTTTASGSSSTGSSSCSSSSSSSSSSSMDAHSHSAPQARGGKSALIGLLVHNATDGIALGATTVSGSAGMSLLVFIAIMMHKAPAAFALSTFLAQSGENQRSIKHQLALFSLAPPVGALVTYYGIALGMVGYSMDAIALTMLFSGGTFLYVATAHVLPEIRIAAGNRFTWPETWALVAGTLMPLLLNAVHSHAH